jgi:hypothetical protein
MLPGADYYYYNIAKILGAVGAFGGVFSLWRLQMLPELM